MRIRTASASVTTDATAEALGGMIYGASASVTALANASILNSVPQENNAF